MVISKLVRSSAKLCFYVVIMIAVGHLLPEPEAYINYDLASKVCKYLYGEVNAESMYDTITNIDFLIIIMISVVFFKISMKIFGNKWRW